MEQATLDFERDEEIAGLPGGLKMLAGLIRGMGNYQQPVRADWLAHALDTNLRSIAASVRELVMSHRLPIGSTRTRPAGYYWIRTREELEAACAMYHETAIELLRREAALKRMTLDELMGQMRLA